ncbi:YaiI/YqxD family protein [Bacillus sp. CGMCC 1.16607]|uniref:YaiI/YqxD family protein n=1 Tax=Bacillus sp. CGMCC 1.16607 TaxID=3351842 RepID=UPI00362DA059
MTDIPTIFVDADACPVKMEIVEIANSFSVNCLFVASYAHVSTDPVRAKWKYVDTHKEAVDFYIMNQVSKGDIVVTQDIGLASTVLPFGVYALSPRGTLYSEETIHTALDLRFLSAKARKQGIYGKGPKAFTQQDRDCFVQTLTKILSNFAGI